MAGPIRNLISMMRENRQQRLDEGTALFPRMRERMGAESPEREERPGVRKLLRSLGVGSSRSDYMTQRKSLGRPVDRTGQEDAMGPDMTYSRPYAGDGVDKQTRTAITTVSNRSPASAGQLPSPVPEPIGRGDVTQSQSVVTGMDDDSLKRQIAAMAMQASQAKDATQVAAIRMKMKAMESLLASNLIDRKMKQQEMEKTFGYNMDQVSAAAKQAVATGQYAPLEALVIGSNALTRTDSSGNILVKPDVRQMVRPHAREHIASTIGRLTQGQGLSQGEQAVLHSAINYAYPVQLVEPESKNPVTPQQMAAEANRLYSEMLVDFPVGSPEQRAFLRSLANVTVKRQAASLGVTGLQLPTN